VIWLHNLFQLQYFNLAYNIFNLWLQYVLSVITICSFRGYNIFNLWLQSKLTILIVDDGSAHWTAVATGQHATEWSPTCRRCHQSPSPLLQPPWWIHPRGGSTIGRMMVAARRPRSTPCGGEQRGTLRSAPRRWDLSSMMVALLESMISSPWWWGRRGFSGRRAAIMASRSASSVGPGVAQATPIGSLHSAARGWRGAWWEDDEKLDPTRFCLEQFLPGGGCALAAGSKP
jgi:hypothetical protein